MEKDLPEEPGKLTATKTATVYSRAKCGAPGKVTAAALRNGRMECPIPIWKLRGEMMLYFVCVKMVRHFLYFSGNGRVAVRSPHS